MATKLEKIHKLEEQVKMLKEKLAYYGKEFMADGHIDSQEQKYLDRMNKMIAKIEANIEKRLEKLGLIDKIKHKAANVVEDVVDAAHTVKDFITGEDHDDHIDKTLPEEEEDEEKTEDKGDEDNQESKVEDKEEEKEEDKTTPVPVVAKSIQKSVGEGGANRKEDVKVIQTLLNDNGASLTVDGLAGKNTYKAIRAFQSKAGIKPDGLISPGKVTFKALLAGGSTPAVDDNTDNQTDDTANDDATSDGDTPVQAGKYFSHKDADKVSISYGSNAVKLNSAAEHLLKSMLANAGLKSAHVTSTLRTYADQARINYEQNSGSQIKQWYGSDVFDTWTKYKAQGKSTADFAAYLESRDKKRGRVMSKHLSGLCLDVTPVSSAYADECKRLKPISGSGVKTYLVEKGCVHTEFTFLVTGGGSTTASKTIEEEEEEDDQATDTTNDNATSDDNGDTTKEPALATTSKISASVGKGGKNKPEDVVLVNTLLNKYGHKFALEPQEEAVKADAALTEAIKKFQTDYRGSTNPDGRVDANGATWGSLLGVARIKGDLLKVAKEYGVEPAVILAIQSIESGGNGFFSDGRPKILFEGHIFWNELKKAGKDPAALQKGNENIIYRDWVKTHYAGGIKEYDRLEKAIKIDREAALKSASWGEFQIMGFNHSVVGYSDVESFVKAMHEAGSNQLGGLMAFLKNNNLIKHVSGAKKDWAALAKGYNGPAYAQNKYDVKLEKAYARFSKLGL